MCVWECVCLRCWQWNFWSPFLFLHIRWFATRAMYKRYAIFISVSVRDANKIIELVIHIVFFSLCSSCSFHFICLWVTSFTSTFDERANRKSSGHRKMYSLLVLFFHFVSFWGCFDFPNVSALNTTKIELTLSEHWTNASWNIDSNSHTHTDTHELIHLMWKFTLPFTVVSRKSTNINGNEHMKIQMCARSYRYAIPMEWWDEWERERWRHLWWQQQHYSIQTNEKSGNIAAKLNM